MNELVSRLVAIQLVRIASAYSSIELDKLSELLGFLLASPGGSGASETLKLVEGCGWRRDASGNGHGGGAFVELDLDGVCRYLERNAW